MCVHIYISRPALSSAAQGFYGEGVGAQAEAGNGAQAGGRQERRMADGLARGDVADVHLDDGQRERADAVGQGQARVGVGARVERDALRAVGARGLQAVDQRAFRVALVVRQLHVRIACAERGEALLHVLRAVDRGFALAQQVQVGAVQDEYLLLHSLCERKAYIFF